MRLGQGKIEQCLLSGEQQIPYLKGPISAIGPTQTSLVALHMSAFDLKGTSVCFIMLRIEPITPVYRNLLGYPIAT